MDIRKISIGADYKSGAMHYIVGQEVLGGSYNIHLIQRDKDTGNSLVWVEEESEIFLWKEFVDMPISVEYNINF